jgi:hypothetical protein
MVFHADLDKTLADSITPAEVLREHNPDLSLDRGFTAQVELLQAFKRACMRASADGKLLDPQELEADPNIICRGLKAG